MWQQAWPKGWLHGLLALGLAGPLGLPQARAATDSAASLQAACNAAAHFSVLQADASAHPAQALWLDATRLQWPGQPADGRYRLVAADAGGLVARPGEPVRGAQATWALQAGAAPLPPALQLRFRHLAPGAQLQLPAAEVSPERLRALHRGALLLVREDEAGRVLQATRVQLPGALDDLYAAADQLADLGVSPPARAATRRSAATARTDRSAPTGASALATSTARTTFRLWAPTARQVWLCLFDDDRAAARLAPPALQADARTGAWHAALPGDLTGGYYSYLVDVWVPGTGLVRQRVTDPYAVGLGTDSRRAWIGRLDAPATLPAGWAAAPRPRAALALADLSIYELHVRDFSVGDASVPPAQRGKYAAFTQAGSAGMRHLQALARAGLTDVHLLPVFDLASVPEAGCTTPAIPDAPPDSPAQQAAAMAGAAGDCFNWGYDPLHYSVPEGSYASRADDAPTRIREFRQMVMALHRAGLRVGMDVVYNHTSASGQHAQSVLDRIVPGYYHRLDAQGAVERSTCCDNTATEHRMMAKLMLDSVRLWAREYRIDGFRFDLMGHQPRAAMLRLRELLRQDHGREIHLLGEGWNFGEVAHGARFVQASQLSLPGIGIATFSDRARDALRGGGVGDGPAAMVARQGWLNGQVRGPADGPDQAAAAAAADLVRLGLAGTLRGYRFTTHGGAVQRGDQIAYAGQAAGYAESPGEVVNYVENHDNHTLWDLNAYKLPPDTPAAERARVQLLALATTAFSQGVAYFHAGVDILRSKSMDGNSYDSGDGFNRLDWSYQTNHFGTGLPPAGDNQALWPLAAPRLADARLRPAPADIAFVRDGFRDLLRIRASSRLFRLGSASAVQQRLVMHGTGPGQNPALVAAELDGRGLPGAGFARVLCLLNTSPTEQALTIEPLRGQPWVLHPVHRAATAADRRAATQASVDLAQGRFRVPGRTAVVFVVAG